jgi:hypothetical protein
VRVNTIGAGIVLAATILHVLTGRRTTSRLAVATSRTLALLVLAGTLVIFWLGVEAAS